MILQQASHEQHSTDTMQSLLLGTGDAQMLVCSAALLPQS